MRTFPLACLVVACSSGATPAGDVFTFRDDASRTHRVPARILVEAQDGGLLLLTRDGRTWPVPPEQQLGRETVPDVFTPLSSPELGEQLQKELGPGFDVWRTRHYVICYNTSREYARFCGQLFERLYRAFTNYWSRRDFAVREPEFPLPVLVFGDPESYRRYALPEVDANPEDVPGFYSLRSNRVSFLDLTRGGAARGQGGRATGSQQARRVLASPGGAFTVATVVHEATHQIAFNCGLQTRYADNPLWLTEGMALYFEAPDPASDRGWSAIGELNELRLRQFREYLERGRPADSLLSLVRDDHRLRDGQLAIDAYAEAWALTYFLVRSRPKQYQAYVQQIGEKTPLLTDDPQRRVSEFQQLFGDPAELDRAMLRYFAEAR